MLPSTRCMEHDDAQDNMLDESSAIMLEYGLQTHPSIEARIHLDTSFERQRSGQYLEQKNSGSL